MGRWLLLTASKLLRLFYVVLVTLLALLGWLLFTTSGAQWLAERAVDEEPRLVVEVRGGSLWNGLELAGLRWQDSGIDVRLEQAELQWNPLCLLQMQVCLGLLTSDGVSVDVDSQALARGDDPDQEEQRGEIELPLTARFPDVRLRKVDIRVDGNRVAWDQLNLSGVLGRQSLRLSTVDVRQLAVELAEGSEPDTEPLETAADSEVDISALLNPANRSRVELPEIRLPLNVYLQDFRVTGASITLPGGQVHHIASLGLSADMTGSDVVVRRFQVEDSMVTASLDGRARLSGEYPLDLQLDAEIRDTPAGEALQVNAALWNSLADLELRVRADGPGTLALDGSARPLEPEMPVDIALDWSSLGWPLEDPALVFSEQGQASIRGDLQGYAFDASLDLTGEDIPAGRWELAGSGDYQGIALERLQGRLLDGRVLLAGDLGWHQGLHWDVSLEAEGINASELVSEAPDALQARLTASGSLVQEALVLDAEIQRLQAVVQGQDLTASGRISHRPETRWQVRGLRVDAGESFVELAGSVDERMSLDGELELAALNRFLPELAGTVSGTFSARGPLALPDIDLNLRASELAWNEEVQVASVRLEASIAALAENNSHLRLMVDGIELPGRDINVEDVRLSADGVREDHRLTLDVTGAPAEVALEISGGLDERLAWEGVIEQADITGAGLSWALEGRVPARWDPEAEQAVLAAHCWRYETARLCAPDALQLGAAGRAAVTLEGYELAWLTPWLPEDIRLLGAVAADVTASWGGSVLPRVDAQLGVTDGSVMLDSDGMGDEPETVELDYDSLALALTLDARQLSASLGLASEHLGRADVDAVVDVDADGNFGSLIGQVQIQALQLAVAQPFFPELRTLEGEISADGALSGNLRDPRFDGTVLLADGTVEPLAVPVTLTGIRLELALQGSQATLTGGFRSGRGEAEVSGEAEWSEDDWDAIIRLSGDRLEFAYDTIATLQASPDLELRIRDRDIALSGRIVIPRANITLQELPEGAVRVSNDVVFVDEPEEPGPEPEEEIPVPEAPGWSFSTELEIVLGNRVELSGFGLTGRLAGQLGIQQVDAGVPQAVGEIRVEEGRYRAYGQRLIIRQGQFLFAGPVDQPEIYVEAVRIVQAYDVVAGLRLEGRPEEPRVSLFSEPGMPEEDVLAFLILGRPISEGGAEGGDMMARAALALGIAGGGGYATAIAEELGIEEFQLDTSGEGDDTQFVVSGYLRPNLFLSYGVGVFTPVNKLTLRYQLSDNLFLEAVSSLENALDLFYTFEF